MEGVESFDLSSIPVAGEEDDLGFTPEDEAELKAYFLEHKNVDETPPDDNEDDDTPSPEIESSLTSYFNELKETQARNEPHEQDEARVAAIASSRRRQAPQPPPPPVNP